MEICVERGPFQFLFRLTWSAKRTGIISEVEGGEHILMWDFDDVPFENVWHALTLVKQKYDLSTIYLLRSSEKGDHFHALCFDEVPWPQAVIIVKDTMGVDDAFWKIGVLRGYFTLRITPKRGERPPYTIAQIGRMPKIIAAEDLFDGLQVVDYYTGQL